MKINNSFISMQSINQKHSQTFSQKEKALLFNNALQSRLKNETTINNSFQSIAQSNINSALETNSFKEESKNKNETTVKTEEKINYSNIIQPLDVATIATLSSDELKNKLMEIEEQMHLELLEIFFKRINIHTPFQQNSTSFLNFSQQNNTHSLNSLLLPSSNNAISPFNVLTNGLSLNNSFTQKYKEEEHVTFDAKGKVNTSDGKEIDFSVNFNMSHSFATTCQLDYNRPLFIDPLVINFDAPAAQLKNTTFSFDINADNVAENLASLNYGSGFLALDKNNSGKIENGNELFGTQSGNGFQDLMQYDNDKNQWIDENDPIFNQLRIFVREQNNTDKLFTLSEKGVGAIHLGSSNTSFSFKASLENETLANLRSTGIFLHENGKVGTIQQIDFNPQNISNTKIETNLSPDIKTETAS